jgi:hypothetical protein
MNRFPVQQFTSVGRVLDPFQYRTNLYIMLATALGGVVAGGVTLLGSGDLGAAVAAGFYTGAAIFMAWVLARDLDPDHDYSAFVAAAVAFVFSPVPVAILPVAALIVLNRIVTRVVGPPARLLDSLMALVLAGAAVALGAWQVGVAAVAAFTLDALLERPLRSQFTFAILTGVLTLALMSYRPPAPLALPGVPLLLAVAVAGGLLALVAARTPLIATPADVPGYSISVARVRAATGVALLLGGLALLGSDAGAAPYLPVWAAAAGIVLYRVGLLARQARAGAA